MKNLHYKVHKDNSYTTAYTLLNKEVIQHGKQCQIGKYFMNSDPSSEYRREIKKVFMWHNQLYGQEVIR